MLTKPLIRFAFCLFAMTLATTATAADEETWYRVRMDDVTVGFTNELRSISTDGTTIRSHTDISVTRMGTPLKMIMLIEERCDDQGRFVDAWSEMTVSRSGTRTYGAREKDSVRYEVSTGGESHTEMLSWDNKAVSQWAAEQQVTRWLAGEEREFRFTVFDVTSGVFKTVRVVREDIVSEDVDGTATKFLRTSEYENDDDVPVSQSLYDFDHQMYRTVIRQMGMEITIERVNSKADIGDVVPSFDILQQSMIPCPDFPEPTARVEDVTLRLELPRALPPDRDFSGPNQAVLARGEDWIEVQLTRKTSRELSMRRSERARFLKADAYIQSDNHRIRAVADSIRIATGESGWGLANALAEWVNRHMTEKNFEQGFASALEALDARAGDCTEHALLLTALLRASGIAARPAVGLVYTGGAFGGHMWAEAYVGHWRSLDALDLDGAPVRLRISTSTDGGAVDERDLMRAYSLVGGMRMHVTAFTLR